jgi:hypothetical protein
MHRRNESIFMPILVWSAIQIGALLLAASRAQLWARMSLPTENYALPIMLAMQIAFVAMLFPWLMQNLRSTVFLFLISALFLQLAGILGDETGWRIARAIWQSWMGLITLALWRAALRNSRAQMFAIAIASSIAIGGACVCYLQMEFTDAAPSPVVMYLAVCAAAVSAIVLLVIRKSFPQTVNR